MAINTDALWMAVAVFTTLCWIIVGIVGLAFYRAKR
jgi:hypothetical protein